MKVLSMSKLRIVVFDLDGVLVPFRSSWWYLQKYFGVDGEVFRMVNTELFYKGLITYSEWMCRDLTLLTSKGCITKDEITNAFNKVELSDGAEEVCNYLVSRGVELAIVSGGIDLLADYVGSRLGIKRIYVNKLLFDDNNCLLPHGVEVVNPLKKDEVLNKLSNELGIPLDEFMYVGDTTWDLSALKVVGYPVILNCSECVEELKKVKSRYYVISSLRDIIPIVNEVIT
jgi:phosphoserine phosphatase